MSTTEYSDNNLILEGDFTLLRKLTKDDCADRYLSWLNDKEVNRYSQREGHVYSISDLYTYVDEMNSEDSNHLLAGIFWKENQEHIGNVLLGPVDFKNRNAEIANMVGEKAYWGKGVAVDADKTLMHYSFSKLNMHKITIGNIAPNKAATFMSRQLGFVPEARLREHVMWQNKYVDVLRFSIMKNEFYQKFPQMKGKVL